MARRGGGARHGRASELSGVRPRRAESSRAEPARPGRGARAEAGRAPAPEGRGPARVRVSGPRPGGGEAGRPPAAPRAGRASALPGRPQSRRPHFADRASGASRSRPRSRAGNGAGGPERSGRGRAWAGDRGAGTRAGTARAGSRAWPASQGSGRRGRGAGLQVPLGPRTGRPARGRLSGQRWPRAESSRTRSRKCPKFPFAHFAGQLCVVRRSLAVDRVQKIEKRGDGLQG